MVVHTTIEDSGGVLADGGGDERLAAGVVLDEVCDVVDDAGHCDQGLAVLGLGHEVVPSDDGELLKGNAPVKLGTLGIELLLLLLETTLLDLVGAEGVQVVGLSDEAHEVDEHLGRVVLPPLDGVAVITWELVVEVVVSLAEGDESSDDVVTRAVAVVERLITEPMCQAVDAEGGLLDEKDAEDTGVDVSTDPVAPTQAANESRKDQAHEDDGLEVVLVLPDDNRVLVQVGDVGAANSLRVLLHDHPADVGV